MNPCLQKCHSTLVEDLFPVHWKLRSQPLILQTQVGKRLRSALPYSSYVVHMFSNLVNRASLPESYIIQYVCHPLPHSLIYPIIHSLIRTINQSVQSTMNASLLLLLFYSAAALNKNNCWANNLLFFAEAPRVAQTDIIFPINVVCKCCAPMKNANHKVKKKKTIIR